MVRSKKVVVVDERQFFSRKVALGEQIDRILRKLEREDPDPSLEKERDYSPYLLWKLKSPKKYKKIKLICLWCGQKGKNIDFAHTHSCGEEIVVVESNRPKPKILPPVPSDYYYPVSYLGFSFKFRSKEVAEDFVNLVKKGIILKDLWEHFHIHKKVVK